MARNDERDPARVAGTDSTGQRRAAGTGAADGITANAGGAFRPTAPQVATPMARRRETAPMATPVDVATPQAVANTAADGITARSGAIARSNRSAINQANNPMSADAETMRRLEISQRGFKGSPSARAAMASALLGQLGASREASQVNAAPVANALTQGANAASAAALSGQQSVEKQQQQQQAGNFQLMGTDLEQSGANARTGASIAGGLQEAQLRSQTDLETTRMQTAPQPQYMPTADGALALVDGTMARTVLDGEGKPMQGPPTGQLTPQALLEAYTNRANAIGSNALLEPAQRDTQLAALQTDPLFAQLFGNTPAAAAGQGQGQRPSLQQYIQGVRAANPGKQLSDDELLAAYRSKFGN